MGESDPVAGLPKTVVSDPRKEPDEASDLAFTSMRIDSDKDLAGTTPGLAPGTTPGVAPAAPADVQTAAGPPARIGRYLVLRRLGEGGMGVVYAGYDEELDRKVAIKLLHPAQHQDSELRARIVREAQALARVSSAHVVHVYEVGEFSGQLFIAMEFVSGTTLTRWQSEKRRSWQELLRMYNEAGQGLLEAHTAGLVHRDFKPDNVLLGSDERPRVADFGLARLQKSAGEAPSEAAIQPAAGVNADSPALNPLTQAGVVMGTPLYMSPEQHLGEDTDHRSDQFSFCVALYEALYQQHPFSGSTVSELARATLSGRIRPRPASTNVPAPVHEALLRGLAKNPNERFPSMQELLAALALDPARDPVTTPRARRWVVLSMPAFIVLSAVGAKLLPALGISARAASLLAAAALCLFFAFVLTRFRRALRNNVFHRIMLAIGMVWGSQLLVFRVIGSLLALPLSQIAMLDLAMLLTISCIYTALILPSLWPQIPVSAAALFLAAKHPEHAELIGSVISPAGMVTSILAWHRLVNVRRKTRQSQPRS